MPRDKFISASLSLISSIDLAPKFLIIFKSSSVILIKSRTVFTFSDFKQLMEREESSMNSIDWLSTSSSLELTGVAPLTLPVVEIGSTISAAVLTATVPGSSPSMVKICKDPESKTAARCKARAGSKVPSVVISKIKRS